MDKFSKSVIDDAIDAAVNRLAASSAITELYPQQRIMLHKFCEGNNILYKGELHTFIIEGVVIECCKTFDSPCACFSFL